MNKLYDILRTLNLVSAQTSRIKTSIDAVIDKNSDSAPPAPEEIITAVTSSERAVKTVLAFAKSKARERFLADLASASSEDQAIISYVFQEAYGEELDARATQEWDSLSIAEQGDIQQAVRAAVFEIEGSKEVSKPLCAFSLKIVGLPESIEAWRGNYNRVAAQLDVLSASRPIPGVTRVVARSVYPLLESCDRVNVLFRVRLPTWRFPDTRKGIVDVTLGYAEAVECWIENQKSSKLGPLTRPQLFTAINSVLGDIRSMNSDVAFIIGCRLFNTYKFTVKEVVSTKSFHGELIDKWMIQPFGAEALGVLNIPLIEPYLSGDRVREEWTHGFFSRYKVTKPNLSAQERQDPFNAFNLQVQKALALKDPVDRYISLNRTIDRFSGVAFVDPVDPQAGAKLVVATLPEDKKPSRPSYQEVLKWRERNLQDICSTLG